MAEFFMMPAASPTMEVGRLANWICAEGDAVEFGTVVAEVETDKATAEIESFDDGVLLKILQPAGADVAVGTPIAIIGEEDDDIAELVAQFESGSTNAAPVVKKKYPLKTLNQRRRRLSKQTGRTVQVDASGVSLSTVKGTVQWRVLSSISCKINRCQTPAYTWHGHHRSIMEMPVSFLPARRIQSVETPSGSIRV